MASQFNPFRYKFATKIPGVSDDLLMQLADNFRRVGQSFVPLPGSAGAPALIPVVTSFPTSPYDGQMVIIRPSSNVSWMFRYNSASASAYKWEFVGGPALQDEKPPSLSTTVTAYGFWGVGSQAQVTAPVAGDYLISFGAYMYNNTPTANSWMGFAVNNVAVAGDAYAMVWQGGTTSTVIASMAKTVAWGGIPAGAVVTEAVRVSGGTGTYNNRFISITPMRCG